MLPTLVTKLHSILVFIQSLAYRMPDRTQGRVSKHPNSIQHLTKISTREGVIITPYKFFFQISGKLVSEEKKFHFKKEKKRNKLGLSCAKFRSGIPSSWQQILAT